MKTDNEGKVLVAGVTIGMSMNCATKIVNNHFKLPKNISDEEGRKTLARETVLLAKDILEEMEKGGLLR